MYIVCLKFTKLRLPLILLVADLFQPIGGLAVECLLNGDVRQSRGGSGPMPVLFAGREPDHVAGMDLFDRSAPAPDAARARGHDQRLPQRVGVPRGPRAGLEGDMRSDGASWFRGGKQ